MLSSDLGLSADSFTWFLYLGLVALWIGSLRSASDWKHLGWRSIPMSLFGWLWVGFGISFVTRFPLLAWDSFTFGNLTSRLADASSDQVDLALLLLGLYFVCLIAAYRLGRGLIAKLVQVQLQLPGEHSLRSMLSLALLSTVGIIFSSGYIAVPRALLTPLGVLGSLWVLPAAMIRWERHRYGEKVSLTLCWLLLLPGLLRTILSPYREHLITMLFAVAIPILFARRRHRLAVLSATLVAVLLASTAVISAYRQYLWEDSSVTEVIESSETGLTLDLAYEAKWVEALRRFVALDSLLLTVRYVPDLIEHSGREVVFSALFRGVVPRVLYEEKEGSTRGIEFGQSIEVVEDPAATGSGAAIAPSMPGDLYDAGGAAMVAIGGFLWGLFLGVLEGWKDRLSPKSAAALVVLFAFHCAASVERDYAHVVSTTIQYLIVMFVVAKLLGGSAGRKVAANQNRRPALGP